MAIFGPITTAAKVRSFGVLDLEWVPGESLPLPRNTLVQIEGLRDSFKIALPVTKKQTGPLQLRIASVYDQVFEEPELDGDEPISTERFECFKTIKDMLDYVLTRDNRGRWFYAHAGGLADMEFVLDQLLTEVKEQLVDSVVTTVSLPTAEERDKGITKHEDRSGSTWRIRASFSGSSAIIIHVSKGKNAWHFIDSYWLLRDKLSNIGRAIGVQKGDTPLAVEYLQKRYGKDSLDLLNSRELTSFYTDAPTDVLVAYNRVDCEILWKAIAQFEKEVLSIGGQLQQTIASTGMSLFRRVYLKQNIYTSEVVNKIAEESYFASRVEVLSRNCEDFLMYDINSSFPYAMTFPQPAGLTEVRTDIPDSWLASPDRPALPTDEQESNIFIADCTVSVPDDMVLPPVPYRMDGRVFFPTGKWRSWLTSTDIRLALREGCTLHKVHEVYCFEPFQDLKGYAEDIYAKRSSATTAFRKLVLKYLLNCLYGKYAERMMKQEMLVNPEEIDRTQMQLLQPGMWLREKEVAITHRHVPISTHITAIARRTLYDYGKMCYAQDLPFYYCDTDSLATKAELPSDDKKLGALKLEKKLDWGEFIAPKIYRGEGFELKNGQWEPVRMAKAKGFSLGKSKAEAWEKFESIAAGDRIGVQRMIRMRELYRTGLTSPIEILVVKALTFEMLSKRFHYPDGETRAWNIKELVSGDVYPKGFDFEPELLQQIDTTTRAMLGAVV